MPIDQILPDFILPSRSHQQWNYSGIDSPELALDSDHFRQYPYPITYQYNSRGFRDSEWPDDLTDTVWCVGDSFTVGVGSPVEHTWKWILEQKLQRRCINISMDGASNQWIARKLNSLIRSGLAKTIVVQWSYFSRRENPNDQLSDESRRMHYDPKSLARSEHEQILLDIENFQQCINSIEPGNYNIVHSVIPNAVSGIDPRQVSGWWYNDRQADWPEQLPESLLDMGDPIVQQLQDRGLLEKYAVYYQLQQFLTANNIILVDQMDDNFNLDLARDGHHYGKKTAEKFVNTVIKLI